MFVMAVAASSESVQVVPPSVERHTWTSELGFDGE
jgi:hypothetical protein